jgi:pre-mRNA-processing factor 17
MHCIPFISVHPSHAFFAGQSMDNKIVVYSCGDKVRQITKKTFVGHNNSGYACKIDFSPIGKYVVSGDGLGQVYFWDWKTTKCYRKFHAHDNGPCMAAVWHPLFPSRVATCGWMDWLKYGTRWFSLTFDCCSINVQASVLTINLFLTFISSQPFLY